ncbi:MAG TPA: hypothetical protein VK766_04255, partial [Cytophagaceae bacterium]|nr:hypothetical protein [Cytophagaceae bacterium]
LLIYKNFFGSSGLLGRAALHTIKVIGPNVGLLKELITDNDIGITCDPENIETIAESLKNIYDIKVPHYSFQKFYLKYSPEMFLKTLLS